LGSRSEAVHDSAKGIKAVEITRTYAGQYLYTFLPANPNAEHDVKWVVNVIEENLSKLPENCSDTFKTQYQAALETFIEDVVKNGGSK
jgi:hypothetical protein